MGNSSATMDAIKKKMQAMKVEKDNAMDRSDACEQAAKDAKVRAAKAEEEVAELVKKSQQLEVELDKTQEELLTTTEKLKEKENALSGAELEVNALNRRVQGLEEDLKKCDEVAKRLQQVEGDLERAEERAETGEIKIVELEEELRVVANNLKSLEVSEEKANQREQSYKA